MSFIWSSKRSNIERTKIFLIKKSGKFTNFFLTAIFIAMCYQTIVCDVIIPSKNLTGKRPDMLCNVGDDHECVCNRSAGDLDGKYLPCDNFLEVKKLFVVCIKMRRVNLNALLYTNESYQQYFRRRIASILSSYCERQLHDCPGTNTAQKQEPKMEQLRQKEESPPENRKSGNVHSSALLEDEDYEPAFTLQNVVILKVTFDDKNRTNVYFVVTKSTSVGLLNNAVTMDPTKIKYILLAQIAPLSRVLGGIRIVEVKLAELKKPPYRSKALIIVITIVGVGFSSCCLIAFIKLFRDQYKKSASSRNQTQEDERPLINYGSCTEKFLPIYDMRNSKIKSKSLNNSARLNKRKSTTCSLKNNTYTAIETDRSDTKALNTAEDYKQSMKNLFKCDPSQLPKESYEFHAKEAEESQWQKEKLFTSKENYAVYNYTKNTSPHNPTFEMRITCVADNVPSVVLISSQSDAFIPETNNNEKKLKENTKNIEALGALDVPLPFERPLSRRGSRESTPEQGVEECDSSREDTPLPLGDELANLSHKNKKNKILATKVTAAEVYMSSSDSENEESKLYHPLENYVSDSDEDHVTKNVNESNGFERQNFSASGKLDSVNRESNGEAQMLDR